MLRTVAVLIAVQGCLAVGCAGPDVPPRMVYEDPTNFVRLEVDPDVESDRPETAHSHPFQISTDDMRIILEGFTVRERRIGLQTMFFGEAPVVPAFHEEEITLLAPQLAAALGEASPQELVTYYLSQPMRSLKRVITTGGLYVRGNHLHFILGNHRVTYGIPAHGEVYDREYPMMPRAPKSFVLQFKLQGAVVEPDTSIWSYLVGQGKDELVINLNKLPVAMPLVSLSLSGQ